MTIKNKISLLVATCMLLFGILIFYVLYQNVKTEVKKNVLHNFNEQQKTILQYQNLTYDRLVESAILICQNPAFKANVSLNDPESVHQIIDEFLNMVKVDLIIVTDNIGTKISAYPDNLILNNFEQKNGIVEALQGKIPEIEFDSPIIWHFEPDIYQVVSVPIATDYEIMGTLTLGTLITDYEAQQLQLSSEAHIHFLNGDHIHASSLEDENVKKEIEGIVLSKLATDSINLIESHNHFVSLNPLDKAGKNYLISTTEKKVALSLLQNILKGMGWLALGALLITICAGGLLGHIISAPMVPVITAFKSIEKGNLSTRLAEDRSDEFGNLSKAFNKMVVGLVEGSHLRKYVGDHTLQKVSEGLKDSEKITAAVMFSDIRGFTSYSQDRSPTLVVTMLNEWLGFQTEIIRAHGGSVDKFVGDEVMAIFKGTTALQDSLLCAQQIQQQATQFDNSKELGLGIGINYGEMILGDIGIDQRKDYTVIGSIVNMAARLCDLAKSGQIAIPSALLKDNKDIEYFTERVSLKGINKKQIIAFIKP